MKLLLVLFVAAVVGWLVYLCMMHIWELRQPPGTPKKGTRSDGPGYKGRQPPVPVGPNPGVAERHTEGG